MDFQNIYNQIVDKINNTVSGLFSGRFIKKDVKQNLLLEWSIKIRHFIMANKNIVMYSLAGLVLLLVLIGFYLSQQEKKINEANKWFERSISLYRRAFVEKELSPEERYKALQDSINGFQYVINNFSGTPLKYDSLMYQGNAYYETQDYNNAIQKYQELIRKKSNYYFADFVLMDIAKCYEQLNNIQSAIDTYNIVINKYKKRSNVSTAMFNLGKIYELSNKLNEAVQIYQQLIQQFPNSIWSQEARRRILFLQTFAPVKQ